MLRKILMIVCISFITGENCSDAQSLSAKHVLQIQGVENRANNLDNGLAETPPMGWNSWNHFGCDINENIIKETADAMVKSGMKEAGYKYIVIDDCWMDDHRDEMGNLTSDPKRFPHGIKWLADYVHSKGLKLGIYSSAGTKTCQGLPASLDHEKTDAQTFAQWGIDYLKYDDCMKNRTKIDYKQRYITMANALIASTRPIVYSIHTPATHTDPNGIQPWQWARNIANMWRTTNDIRDNWQSVMAILDQQVGLHKYAGPGHWNDPDMLEVGNSGMNPTEYRAHFSLWAILSAPLIAGNDLRNMSSETVGILSNDEVIAVNQEAAIQQGHKIVDNGDREVWAKQMSDGSVAVVLLNRAKEEAFMTADVETIGLPDASSYKIRDLWQHKVFKNDGLVRAHVPSHGAAMFRIWPSR